MEPTTKNSSDSLYLLGFESLGKVSQVLLTTSSFDNLVQAVVNSVLGEVEKLGHDFHIAVLALQQGNILKRISMSDTSAAISVRGASATPFEAIETPLSAKNNLCIKSLTEKKSFLTYSFQDILHPPFDKAKCDRLQKAGEIRTSAVFPIIVKGNAIGIIIFSTKQNLSKLNPEEETFISNLTGIIGIAVENARLFEQVEKERLQLQKANAKLRELDHLKDEFVSLASHELRTPLTSIKYYLWMTLQGKGGKLEEKQRFFLDRAYSSTTRLTKMVNDMLNISRIESNRVVLSPFKTKIHAIAEDVADEVRPKAKELGIRLTVASHGLKLHTQREVDLPDVLIDRDKIKEVLVNLIGNALKFTPKKGSVKVWFEVNDDFVYVHVTDSGIGFDPAKEHQLFKKFGMIRESYAAYKDASQGTGLGLYICKSIIDLHGGHISAESEGQGKGATFSFSIPIYTEKLKTEFSHEFAGKTDAGIIMTQVMAE